MRRRRNLRSLSLRRFQRVPVLRGRAEVRLPLPRGAGLHTVASKRRHVHGENGATCGSYIRDRKRGSISSVS